MTTPAAESGRSASAPRRLWKGYEAVIGLETHVQLRTRTKLFCGCPTAFGADPNSAVCPVCLGHPGSLPAPNREAISLALRLALAVRAEIHEESIWARKNYFYPDLPKGYQITQFERPIATGGHVTIHVDEARGGAKPDPEDPADTREVVLRRIHLEEDAGKSKHPETGGDAVSLVDLNRAGTPLVEIVTEPVLTEPEEAVAYLMALRQLVQYLGVSDGNMEEGSFRCDANISVRPAGSRELGTRVEIKNLNSFRFVERAIAFEIARQIDAVERGQRIDQETRLWDVATEVTRTMRGKEDAEDYRYFPDPDLPPLRVTPAWIEEARSRMAELPEARRTRFHEAFGLPLGDVVVLTQTRELGDYFEEVVRATREPRLSANWVRGELLAWLNKRGLPVSESPIEPERLAKLLLLVQRGTLSGKLAKQALEEMFETGEEAAAVVARHGWILVTDDSSMQEWIDTVLAAHPEERAAYREGKDKLFHFFVGQVMRLSRGQADPERLKALLEERLRAS